MSIERTGWRKWTFGDIDFKSPKTVGLYLAIALVTAALVARFVV
jgi:hypothetical protein